MTYVWSHGNKAVNVIHDDPAAAVILMECNNYLWLVRAPPNMRRRASMIIVIEYLGYNNLHTQKSFCTDKYESGVTRD